MRASNVLPVEEHTALVEKYLAAVAKEKRNKLDNARVVVTGAFCEQPPIALIRALEASGCYVVDDDWVLGARYLLGDVATGEDPLADLANAYLGDCVETASRYETRREKGAFLIERVKRYRAEGVIFCAPSFCDPALLERPDADRGAQPGLHSSHVVQLRREHQPVPRVQGTDRHLRRLHQAVGARMNAATRSRQRRAA